MRGWGSATWRASLTSPRLRGEVGLHRRCNPGEGEPPRASMFGICGSSPSPTPLPAKSGERAKRSTAASRQFRFRNLLRQPRPQRRQPLRMVAPFADRGRIDRTAYLNGAGGRRRRRAFVEPQHLIIPGKPDELNEKPARRRLVPHDVLVIYFQKHFRRQGRPPVL